MTPQLLLLALSLGRYDIFRSREPGLEVRVDLRLPQRAWIFRPMVSTAVVSNGSTYLGAGVWFELPLTEQLVITPQFTPTWWRGATPELDLGFPLEFRSRFEVDWVFAGQQRVGVFLDHSSNANIGPVNPGVETLGASLVLPL